MMLNFIDNEIVVSELGLCMYIRPGGGLSEVTNRREHGFIYDCSGPKKYLFSDGTEIESGMGGVVFVPKHSTYRKVADSNGDCYIINFNTTKNLSLKPFVFAPKNTSDIRKCFDNAENIWKAKNIGYYEKCLSELYSLICLIKKEGSVYSPSSTYNIIEPALKYIHENFFKENISIENLASMCNISEQYLRRIFASVCGEAPLKYINNLKMLRARELIKSGNYSMREVSELSGFFDYSYFSREFKKSAGVTPSEYSGKR